MTILIYRPNQSAPEVTEMDVTPELLRTAIGCQYPGLITFFDNIEYGGSIQDCVAFADVRDERLDESDDEYREEYGDERVFVLIEPEEMPQSTERNEVATKLWDTAFHRSTYVQRLGLLSHVGIGDEFLVGPVVVVLGNIQAAVDMAGAIVKQRKEQEFQKSWLQYHSGTQH
jgi:hypothetical protein